MFWLLIIVFGHADVLYFRGNVVDFWYEWAACMSDVDISLC